jgi:ATP-binding cassette subfamily B protein
MQTGESAGLKIQRALRLDFALRLVWQSAPGWTMASLALLVVQGALPLVSLYLMKLVVDAVTTALESPDKGAAFGRVGLLIGLTGGVALVSALLRSLAGLVSEAQGQVVTDHLSDLLHAKSIEVDLEYYESAQYYDKLHRAQREAPFRPIRILNGLVQVAQSGISLLAMAGLLFSFHWGIAAILFAAAVPGLFVRLRYAGQTYRWQRQRTSAERQAWYFHWLLTGDVHAKEIRQFDLGSLFRRRFRNLRQQLRQEKIEIATRRSIAELVTQASATIAVFGSYTFIAYRTVQGAITLGDLVMYYQAFQRGQGFLREMLSGLAGLYEDNLFLSNLYEFLDLKPKVVEPRHPKPLPQPMQTGIAFDHVSFQYPTGTREVLEDINLTIRPGEVVALVGENGSGKTTLIKLLCRLYDPTSGIITLDGIDLRQLETTALRREISVIFQDYAQYHLTARENIWFGNASLPPDEERIAAAARHAGADEVIDELPQGYETILGKWFEDGEELSVGEWQKVALARAFLRDAQIIVLDEPTGALDARAEYEVFKKFRQLAAGRTVILISHRFSTVRMADRIYVLEDGRIIESGTHDELVSRGGTYARLFETQAQYYR